MSLSRSTRNVRADALREDEPKSFEAARFFRPLIRTHAVKFNLNHRIAKDQKPEDRVNLKR